MKKEKKLKPGWYLITKYFRGGMDKYAFKITKKIQKRFEDFDELLEYIGEHTDGGSEDGYNIKADLQKTKPSEKTLRFKIVEREVLIIE